jgi:2-polyprenyl-6-methoxyphenol hydroxylase-like FAD-dependent oxidoreductase
MQFHHPHGFRQQVGDALLAEMPEVYDGLLAAGATPTTMPDDPSRVVGLNCRRWTFERVLRAAAVAEPGVSLHIGHADDVLRRGGRATGLRVDGHPLYADLVLNASGRAGRLGDALRVRGEGGDCGIAYVSRQYELLPGAERGPANAPIGQALIYRGYQAFIFYQDNRTFAALLVRLASDDRLAVLREADAFQAAVGAIPGLAAWTAPDRSRPITAVLPGGRLHNTYRGQLDDAGRVGLPGLAHVGDAVCTTNPTAGRGIALSLRQAQHLIGLLDEHSDDVEAATLAFDAWCTANIRPWFDDHVHWDEELIRRWSGLGLDLTRRLPSDLIMAATEVDPSMMEVVGPYLGMQALPATLAEVEPRAREIFAGGWRPPVPAGPSRDELAELVTAAAA